MSGGKGGSITQAKELPAYINEASEQNIELANKIAQLGPIRNYGPTVAAFNEAQQAGFANNNNLASAFGMQAPSSPMAGMPQAQNYGGVSGHSASGIVDQQLASLKQNDPNQFRAMNDLYMDPGTSLEMADGSQSGVNPLTGKKSSFDMKGIIKQLMSQQAKIG